MSTEMGDNNEERIEEFKKNLSVSLDSLPEINIVEDAELNPLISQKSGVSNSKPSNRVLSTITPQSHLVTGNSLKVGSTQSMRSNYSKSVNALNLMSSTPKSTKGPTPPSFIIQSIPKNNYDLRQNSTIQNQPKQNNNLLDPQNRNLPNAPNQKPKRAISHNLTREQVNSIQMQRLQSPNPLQQSNTLQVPQNKPQIRVSSPLRGEHPNQSNLNTNSPPKARTTTNIAVSHSTRSPNFLRVNNPNQQRNTMMNPKNVNNINVKSAPRNSVNNMNRDPQRNSKSPNQQNSINFRNSIMMINKHHSTVTQNSKLSNNNNHNNIQRATINTYALSNNNNNHANVSPNNNNNNNEIQDKDKIKRQTFLLELLDNQWSEDDLFSELNIGEDEDEDEDEDIIYEPVIHQRSNTFVMNLLDVEIPDVTMFAHFEDEDEESKRVSVRRTTVAPGAWEGWQRRIKRQTWEDWESKITVVSNLQQLSNANFFVENNPTSHNPHRSETDIQPLARDKEIDGRLVAPYWLFKWWLTKNTTNRPTISKHPLLELLLEDNLMIVSALGDILKNEELNKFALCITRIFDGCGKVLALVHHYIKKEIDATSHSNTLFRNNTLTTKVMTSYSKIAGVKFLRNLFGPIISDLFAAPASTYNLEIDAKKLVDNSMLSDQVERLLALTQRFLDAIIDQIDQVPFVIRQICHCLYGLTEAKFPDCANFGVAGFIFLRFICPAIVAPDTYGVVKTPLSSGLRRTLILVSKVLQNLANGTKVSKEGYMKPTDIFVEQNYDAIQHYFQEIATVPQVSKDQKKNGFSIIPVPLIEESLSIVHHIIIKEIEQLKEQLSNCEVVETVSYNVSENLQTVLLKSSTIVEYLKIKEQIHPSSPLFKPYTLLIDGIMANGCSVIRSLLEVTGNSTESELLCEALMVVVHNKGNSLGFIKSHIIKEVKAAKESKSAFSKSSISNQLIWGYMKILIGGFLTEVWGDIVKIVNDSNTCLDIDPARSVVQFNHEPIGEDFHQRKIQELSEACGIIAFRIFDSAHKLHPRILELCNYIQLQMSKKFGNVIDSNFAIRLLFERVFLYALSQPALFYLLPDMPNFNARKTFQIASLFLRCCITGKLFAETDYLSVLNNVAATCRKQATTFLSTVNEIAANTAQNPGEKTLFPWELFCDSLIFLHSSLNTYLPAVVNSLKDTCIEETIVYNIFDRLASVIALYRYKLRRKSVMK